MKNNTTAKLPEINARKIAEVAITARFLKNRASGMSLTRALQISNEARRIARF